MSRCEQAEPDSSTSSGYYQELPGTPCPEKRSSTRDVGNKCVKARHRRVKANTRERNRMHGLNDALEMLRGHIPLSYHHQRLSKIETLRLARNYIAILSKSLQSEGPPTNMDCARTLAEGLSQTTSNLIASTFQVHPRLLLPEEHPCAVTQGQQYTPVPCAPPQPPFPIPVEYPQPQMEPQPEPLPVYYPEQHYYYQPMQKFA